MLGTHYVLQGDNYDLPIRDANNLITSCASLKSSKRRPQWGPGLTPRMSQWMQVAQKAYVHHFPQHLDHGVDRASQKVRKKLTPTTLTGKLAGSAILGCAATAAPLALLGTAKAKPLGKHKQETKTYKSNGLDGRVVRREKQPCWLSKEEDIATHSANRKEDSDPLLNRWLCIPWHPLPHNWWATCYPVWPEDKEVVVHFSYQAIRGSLACPITCCRTPTFSLPAHIKRVVWHSPDIPSDWADEQKKKILTRRHWFLGRHGRTESCPSYDEITVSAAVNTIYIYIYIYKKKTRKGFDIVFWLRSHQEFYSIKDFGFCHASPTNQLPCPPPPDSSRTLDRELVKRLV